MLVTFRVIGPHASSLGVLLGMCPDKLHTAELPVGRVHVFFPEVTAEAVTAALVLDVDAIDWSSNGSRPGIELPHAGLLSVVIAKVFGAALAARSLARPDLVTKSLAFEVGVSSLACAGGVDAAKALFGPLGYGVEVAETARDPQSFPGAWCSVRLTKSCPLHELLAHLFVLGPVLDGHASSSVLDQEVPEILRYAEGFVRGHPAAERIMQAYAVRRPQGARAALERLVAVDMHRPNTDLSVPPSLLDDARADAIVAALRAASPHTVIDLGCGEGKLLARLVREKALTRIVGLDISQSALDAAAARMKLDRRGGKKSERIELMHGSLFYKDKRLAGFDAAVLVDVVQHLESGRLQDLEGVVFEYVRPSTVLVVANLMTSKENETRWTSNEFDAWASVVSQRRAYKVRLSSIGSASAPARMAVFSR